MNLGGSQRDDEDRSKTLYCPCGRQKVLALGLCASCHNLKRQDEEYFGGLRELVLERDEHRCRGCGASGRGCCT
jgi:hypothetical protein